MRQRLVVAGVLASFALASNTSAQQPTERSTTLARVLTPMRTVRLHLADGRTPAGTVVTVTDSVVAIGACMRCSFTPYRLPDVTGVDTMVGHPVHAPRVAAGAFAGGAIAAGTYAALASRGGRRCHEACGLWEILILPTFAAGALVGGVIGAFHPYIHWDPVVLPVSSAPTAARP